MARMRSEAERARECGSGGGQEGKRGLDKQTASEGEGRRREEVLERAMEKGRKSGGGDQTKLSGEKGVSVGGGGRNSGRKGPKRGQS